MGVPKGSFSIVRLLSANDPVKIATGRRGLDSYRTASRCLEFL
jgi:hypothetical protein